MKTTLTAFLAALMLAPLMASTQTVAPNSNKKEGAVLSVEGGYIFKPLSGSNATAGYGILKNTGSEDLNLAIVSAEGFKAVELHETVTEKGIMKMRKVNSFQIKKGGSFELKPRGNHIMLFDATRELKEGEMLHVTFKNGEQKITLPFELKPRTQKPAAQDPHAHH